MLYLFLIGHKGGKVALQVHEFLKETQVGTEWLNELPECSARV